MFRVTMQRGGKVVKKYTFDKKSVTIGREPTCDIPIDNIGASREHATIEETDEGHILADLGSQNGTFVRGEKIFHHKLKDGDEFFIGKLAFVFEQLDPVVDVEGDGAESAAAAPQADMTFHLDRKELERIMSQSALGAASQLVQVEPAGTKNTVVLDKPFCLIGKVEHARIKLSGLFAPAAAAVIVRTEHGYRVVSISKKFTINDKFVADCPLSDGDKIRYGGVVYRFSQA